MFYVQLACALHVLGWLVGNGGCVVDGGILEGVCGVVFGGDAEGGVEVVQKGLVGLLVRWLGRKKRDGEGDGEEEEVRRKKVEENMVRILAGMLKWVMGDVLHVGKCFFSYLLYRHVLFS